MLFSTLLLRKVCRDVLVHKSKRDDTFQWTDRIIGSSVNCKSVGVLWMRGSERWRGRGGATNALSRDEQSSPVDSEHVYQHCTRECMAYSRDTRFVIMWGRCKTIANVMCRCKAGSTDGQTSNIATRQHKPISEQHAKKHSTHLHNPGTETQVMS